MNYDKCVEYEEILVRESYLGVFIAWLGDIWR